MGGRSNPTFIDPIVQFRNVTAVLEQVCRYYAAQ
jgi:hypothetical protein